jgi:flagellar motor switch protein FliG
MDRIRAYKKEMGADSNGDGDGEDRDRDRGDWLARLVESEDEKEEPEKKGVAQKAPSKDAPNGLAKVPSPSSKYERLAKFLVLINETEAAKILAGLPKAQAAIIQKNTEELKELKGKGRVYGMTAEEARSIYEEFQAVISVETGIPMQQQLAFLNDLQPEQIALLLHKEAAQTCALVLARIPPKLAAGTLGFIEAEKKREIVFRIARLKPVSPEVICVIANTLRDRTREIGTAPGASIDGVATLAEILKNTDVAFGDKIISSLASEDPSLGRTLKERLYTLDDVCRAENKPISEKLAAMSEKDIVLLIRGRSANFVEKIMSNISSGRRALVQEENDIMGAVLKSDAEAAIKDFLQWFRDKREKGEVLFLDDEFVV